MATIKHPKEIKQVALSIRNTASALAPYNSGNLRNSLNAYNTPDRMIKYLPNGNAVISYYNSPPSAKYGKFWNEPATNKSRTKHRPEFGFADKAIKAPDVNRKIKEYAKALGKQIALEIREAIRQK